MYLIEYLKQTTIQTKCGAKWSQIKQIWNKTTAKSRLLMSQHISTSTHQSITSSKQAAAIISMPYIDYIMVKTYGGYYYNGYSARNTCLAVSVDWSYNVYIHSTSTATWSANSHICVDRAHQCIDLEEQLSWWFDEIFTNFFIMITISW